MSRDDVATRLAEARDLVGMLRARGDHVDVARRVTFELLVPADAMTRTLDEARRAGFDPVAQTPGRLARRIRPRRQRVHLQRFTSVDEPTAEAFTRTLVAIAARAGGRFELWLPDPVGQGRQT